MIVIGGLGSVHGAFLGAMFLISMPQLIALGKDYLPEAIGQAPGLQAVVYGLVLIAFVLFEPLGLYGRWLKVRTWLQLFPFYRGHVQAPEVVPEIGPPEMTDGILLSAKTERALRRRAGGQRREL
jgi:hypothetical protein